MNLMGTETELEMLRENLKKALATSDPEVKDEMITKVGEALNLDLTGKTRKEQEDELQRMSG